MTITLAQIDAFFDGLSKENQLRLLEHLADRTDYADDLAYGQVKAAKSHAFFATNDLPEADHLVGQLAFLGGSHKDWEAFSAERDRHLIHAIGWNKAA